MVYKTLNKILLKITPAKVKSFFKKKAVKALRQEQEFSILSYSQEGEDSILIRFLENKEKGFYVDIGAHHPKRFSNTYLFYKKGWRGINIDAMPGSMHAFKKERPEDINLEIGISKSQGELNYYMFNESALNTFSTEVAKNKSGLRDYKIIETRKVITYPLKDILNEYLDKNKIIDFMSVDVEGLDLEVLSSNDWENYRPHFILVEDLQRHSISDIFVESDVYLYLHSLNYELVAKTFNTLIFKDKVK